MQIRQYWFVALLKGNNRTQDSATAAKYRKGTWLILHGCMKQVKLRLPALFGDDGDWRGIFILMRLPRKKWNNY